MWQIVVVTVLAIGVSMLIPFAAAYLNMGKHTSHFRSRRRTLRGTIGESRRNVDHSRRS